MSYCPNCGAGKPTPATVCPACGSGVPASSQQMIASRAPLSRDIYAPQQYDIADAMASGPRSAYHATQGNRSSVAAPPLKPPPGLTKGTIMIVLLLAALLMFSGVGIIYYTLAIRPIRLRAAATATVQALLTADTHTTATANARVTGTVQAQNQANATAQAQAAAQAQATATVYANLYARSTAGTPALSASLAAQSPALWDVFTAQGNNGGCAFTGTALRSSITLHHTYVPCFARLSHFTDFAYEVQMTIIQGDDGGLIFRSNDVNGKFYFFSVGRDGIYSLSVSKDSTHSTQLVYDRSSLIKTAAGQLNILTVIARGSNIYLYINNQFVGNTTDSTYGSGEIGVFADDMENATMVEFRNARVWAL